MAGLDIRFSHIGVWVHDLDAMEHFYTRVLGFLVTDRGELGPTRLVFMSRDPSEHHQLVLATGRPEELQFNVVNQLSFRLGSLPDLRTLHALLEREGAGEIRPVNHGISWSVYARDPEGNRLELFVDTPWYVPQPLRDPLDLSKSDDAIVADTEAQVTADPKYQPMVEWRAALAHRIEAGLRAGPAA